MWRRPALTAASGPLDDVVPTVAQQQMTAKATVDVPCGGDLYIAVANTSTRDRALFERELVSEDQFESRRSEFESAQAFFDETQGIIAKKLKRRIAATARALAALPVNDAVLHALDRKPIKRSATE
jgi:hypothetical protein